MAKQKKSKKTQKSKGKKKDAVYVVPLKTPSRKPKASQPKFPSNIWPLKKRVKPAKVEHHPLPPAYKLLSESLKLLLNNWKLFLGISAVYGLLELIFVRSFSLALDLSTAKSDLTSVFHGHVGNIGSSLGQFVTLLSGTSNTVTPSAGIYQFLIVVVGSLAIIWTIRQLYGGIKPRIRDGWYKGTYPLVPALLILSLIALELIPFIIGVTLVIVADSGEIAVTVAEKIAFGLIGFGFASLTIRWLCSTLFGLYIVTLPDLTPMVALRTARDLVRYRRLIIIRKVGFLPVCLLVAIALIMTPTILFLTPIASWIFFLLTLIIFPIIHSYIYVTYRELL